MAPVLAADPAPGAATAHRENRVRGSQPLRWDRLGVDAPISLERTGENGSVYDGSRRQILYYLRARYYDPAIAQFLTRDPMVATTRSPYGYVGGDPLNGTDPTGLDWWNPTTWNLCLRNPFGGDNNNGGCHTPLSTSQGRTGLGIVAGAAAAVTGVGAAVDIGAFGFGSGVLSGVSFATGTGAGLLDGPACLHGDRVACVGAGLGVIGGFAALPDLVGGAVGVAEDSVLGGVLKGISAFGLNLGFIGTGVDITSLGLSGLAQCGG